jgi:uncharacterized protein YcnI
VAALLGAAAASAHARISPAVSLAGEIQLYSLAVPTEQAGLTTTKVVLSVPAGFSIDSFVASPGWHRTLSVTAGAGNAVTQRVTWSGGSVPDGEDAFFEFLGEPANPGTFSFLVAQTYSNGLLVNWSGPPSSATPAPTIEAKSSLGGGGTPLLTIVALVVAIVGVVVATIALVTRGSSRPLA